ncbi:UNVERIFIED_ORG: hypothetical protein J2Y81_001952 [Paraburkholderia sediminicola]|nr:hypothetical protein [Paraburkholderia sediminicola]
MIFINAILLLVVFPFLLVAVGLAWLWLGHELLIWLLPSV